MKKRMWLGLLLLCIQELLSLIISTQVKHSNCELPFEFSFLARHHDSSSEICLYSIMQYDNSTLPNTTDCVSVCPSSVFTMDSTLMWLLVPQILHGFGYMLVFMTVLEFICAQAPYKLKGFMIGIWYAMFSIKYALIGNVDTAMYYKEEKVWIIYQSIKIAVIGLSVILFAVGCRWYRYRERDEVVNVQGMIENIFEKELLQQQDEESEDTLTVLSPQTNYNTFD